MPPGAAEASSYEAQLAARGELIAAQRRYEQEQYIAQNRYGQQQLGYNGY